MKIEQFEDKCAQAVVLVAPARKSVLPIAGAYAVGGLILLKPIL